MNPEGTESLELPGLDGAEALRRATGAVGGTPRQGQIVMAQAVADALRNHEHLLVQAGTGTGKSLAYLVPAFAHALDAGPVVVATATLALQRQLVERDIPAIMESWEGFAPRPLSAAVLKGRHHYLCRLRLESGADSTSAGVEEVPLWTDADPGGGRLTRQAAEVRQWAQSTTTGDRDDVPEPVDSRVWRAVSVTAAECIGRQRCSFGEDCFAERARDAAREADVVVTNHAMLALEIVEGIPVLPEHEGIIIDEGHEWIDRATSAATLHLSIADVDSLAAAVKRSSDGAAGQLQQAGAALRSALEIAHPPTSADTPLRLPTHTASRPVAITDAIIGLRAAVRGALTSLSPPEPDDAPAVITARQRLRAELDAVITFADRYLTEQDATDTVVWISARSSTVNVAPLSIADHLRARMGGRTLVLTSATLGRSRGEQPFDDLARALGIEDEPWRGLDVGSPFDFARQGILYVAAHLPEPGREGLEETVLDELGELIEAAGGRALALFSSWRGVERAGEYLPVRLGRQIPVLVQHRGDPVGPLVEEFRAVPESVLVGTVSLWQGVDVPGDSCRLVIIDRIPFTRPDDPVLAARSERADEEGGSGFEQVALPRAATLLAQGVGRLIRGTEDRGVVALLDRRLVTRGYGRRLRDALPPLWFTTDGELARGALRRLDHDPGT